MSHPSITLDDSKLKQVHDFLRDRTFPVGMGTNLSACSIASINLALDGELTDDIPECMSNQIGSWIIGIQDAMPDRIRNGAAWRKLLPYAAGTGRDRALEHRRSRFFQEHMWGTVLPLLTPQIKKRAYAKEKALELWNTALQNRQYLDRYYFRLATAGHDGEDLMGDYDDSFDSVVYVIEGTVNEAYYDGFDSLQYIGDNWYTGEDLDRFWDTIDPVGTLADAIDLR